VARRENLTQLFEIAFSHVNEECRKSGLNVILEVVHVFVEKHRQAEGEKKGEDYEGVL
jgi:hypothetical protein